MPFHSNFARPEACREQWTAKLRNEIITEATSDLSQPGGTKHMKSMFTAVILDYARDHNRLQPPPVIVDTANITLYNKTRLLCDLSSAYDRL